MVEYRKLIKEHIREIADIYVDAFNCEPWNDAWTIESASNRISQMINCEGFDGLVAYEGEKLIGMILGNHEYYYDAMIFQIKEFCVSPQVKGTGIGTSLLDEFTTRLKDKGIARINLITLRTDKTEGFYKKNGYESFEDMVIMGKEI